jgi:hypothetical protein
VIVHMLEFRVVPGREAEVTAFLRHPPPADGHPDDAPVTCTGRRLGRQHSEYILTSVWRDARTFERETDPAGRPVYLTPKLDLLASSSCSAFAVLSAHWGDAFEGSKILRVYRGSVHASDMAEWLKRVDKEAPAVSVNTGLRAVLIGTVIPMAGEGSGEAAADGQMAVMAISAWSDWNAVLTATGGHIDRPVLFTEVEDIETPSSVNHYQLLDPEPTPSEPPA